MKAKLKREVLINAGWFSGLALALVAVVGVSVTRLNAQKSRIADLRQEIEAKKTSLEQWSAAAPDEVDPEETLSDWLGILSSESQRVSELSDAARSAGVTLVAIRCLQTEYSEDGLVASVTHELGALGSYRELGTFFARIYTSRGTVGIEQLEIAGNADDTADQLRASLRVTWYAKGTGQVAEAEEEG